MKNIAVIFGGKSVEHDISIITALQTMKNFPRNYNFLPIYIKPKGNFVVAENLDDGKVYLDYENSVKKEKAIVFQPDEQSVSIFSNKKLKGKLKIDCALLCTHGHGGEDGCLQGLLELCDIPYTSCDVAASAIIMDKVLTKVLLEKEKIKTPAYVHFDKCEYANEKELVKNKIVKKIKMPCIIKPARLGSSVGISICENEHMIFDAIENALLFDDKIIVEKFVQNAREFCCAVFSNESEMFESQICEVKKGKIFTFEEKYLQEKQKEESHISKSLQTQIKKKTREVYKILSCAGVVRVDFLYDEAEEELYVNEVNSIPGSLAFNLFDTSFGDLIDSLICNAIRKKEEKINIQYQYNSSAISNFINIASSTKCKL